MKNQMASSSAYRGSLTLAFLLAFLATAFSLGLLGVSTWFLAATALAGLVPAMAAGFDTLVPSGFIRLFALGRTTFRYAERLSSHDATFGILALLRTRIYRAVNRLSPSELGGLHSAETLSRMTRDIDLLSDRLIRLALPMSSVSLLYLTAALVLALKFAYLLPGFLVFAFVSLILLPALAYLSGRRFARNATSSAADLGKVLVDSLDSAMDLSLHRPSLARMRERFRQKNVELIRAERAYRGLGSLFRSLLLLSGAIFGLWSYFRLDELGLFHVDGAIPAALLVLSFGLYETAMALPQAWAAGGISSEARARVQDTLRKARAKPQARTTLPEDLLAEGTVPELRIKGLGFAYDRDTVIEDLDLVVEPGQHLLILGPSGCGKSTLLSLICGLETAGSGSIRFGNARIEELAEEDLRSLVTLALQEPWLAGGSLADNLRMARPAASDEEIWRVLELVGLADTLKSWPEGIETWVEEGGASLSGGQRRRVNIARALLRNCPITLLDEPAEGLSDRESEELYRRLRKELAGKTLVVAAHRAADLGAFESVFRI